jgi:excisionase family DNA binding protein
MEHQMIQKLLQGKEVADQLGISKAFAYRLMATGQIKVVRMGKSVRCRQEDLEDFILSNLHSNKAQRKENKNDTNNFG